MPNVKLSSAQISILIPLLESIKASQRIIKQDNLESEVSAPPDVTSVDVRSANAVLHRRSGKATLHMLTVLLRLRALGRHVPLLAPIEHLIQNQLGTLPGRPNGTVSRTDIAAVPFVEAFDTFCTTSFRDTAPYALRQTSVVMYMNQFPMMFRHCDGVRRMGNLWLVVGSAPMTKSEMRLHISNGFPEELAPKSLV